MGTRIAVIADAGDDISSLEIPAEDTAPAKEESSSSASTAQEKESTTKAEPSKPAAESKPKTSGAGQKQKYPLYPSVQMLLHTNNLNAEDISPTGPNGRLLKGDVLAYLEQIAPSYPEELAARFSKLSHLDLSNIKLAAPKAAPEKEAEPVKADEKIVEAPVDVAIPVSLAAVLEVQRRMEESLGITLPLSTFVARAIALANEDLPYSRKAPTADELFDSVLGLDRIHPRAQATTNGSFEPQIVALPDPSLRASRPVRAPSRKADLFDEIVGGTKAKSSPVMKTLGAVGAIGTENIFSLSVKRDDEKSARVFLQRVKSVLEAEPGRLVL